MSNDNAEKKRHVTITKGMRGYFAVMVWWNPEDGGFWEPWQTAVSSYTFWNEPELIAEAKAWAEAEGVEFKPYG